MTLETKRYRAMPVEIEAVQFVGTNAQEIIDWINGCDHPGKSGRGGGLALLTPEGEISIPTWEGQLTATLWDHVVRGGAKGEFWPIKPAAFALKYSEIAP